jgi:hypothetical protein
MNKSEFRKKRYDKFCWQVYRGDDLAGLIEEFRRRPVGRLRSRRIGAGH